MTADAVSPVGSLVVALLGVGGGTAIVLLLLTYVVKGAIVTAVEQAGKQELVRLKAELDERLASKRQEFEVVVEDARRTAAHDLESFKAELQLASEVRRQVAAKKVSALIDIATSGEALQRDVLNVRPNNSDDRARAMSKLAEYGNLVRSSSFLFQKSVAAKFHQYAADLLRAELDLNTKLDASALERAMVAVDGFLELARSELGVSADPSQALPS